LSPLQLEQVALVLAQVSTLVSIETLALTLIQAQEEKRLKMQAKAVLVVFVMMNRNAVLDSSPVG
jgi:hypothetical protein